MLYGLRTIFEPCRVHAGVIVKHFSMNTCLLCSIFQGVKSHIMKREQSLAKYHDRLELTLVMKKNNRAKISSRINA